MKIVCILPVYNEAEVLEEAVQQVWDWGRRRFQDHHFSIIISENGSTDETKALARALDAAVPEITAILSDLQGKGGAIKRGMAAVEADVYVFMDIDLSTDLDSAWQVVNRVLEGGDLAIASRRAPGAQVSRPILRRLMTATYAAASSLILGLDVADPHCGCKVMTRRVRDEVMPMVEDEGWFFDSELLARALKAGYEPREVGVRWLENGAAGRPSKLPKFATSLEFLKKMLILRRRI
jgi:glycosyltransferase involved in cell wall biosynthesis